MRYLNRALCVGCPSTTEGFGLPPLEGMVLGCPAIMAPCGALTEVGGEGALFAAPDDPRQWVAAIRGLADEPDHWTHYSRAGRERASYFTWKRAGERLLGVIREVAVAERSCDPTVAYVTIQPPSRIAIVIASTGRPVELGRWVDHLRRQTVQPTILVYAVVKPTDLPDWEKTPDGVKIVLCAPGLPIQRNAALRRSNGVV